MRNHTRRRKRGGGKLEDLIQYANANPSLHKQVVEMAYLQNVTRPEKKDNKTPPPPNSAEIASANTKAAQEAQATQATDAAKKAAEEAVAAKKAAEAAVAAKKAAEEAAAEEAAAKKTAEEAAAAKKKAAEEAAKKKAAEEAAAARQATETPIKQTDAIGTEAPVQFENKNEAVDLQQLAVDIQKLAVDIQEEEKTSKIRIDQLLEECDEIFKKQNKTQIEIDEYNNNYIKIKSIKDAYIKKINQYDVQVEKYNTAITEAASAIKRAVEPLFTKEQQEMLNIKKDNKGDYEITVTKSVPMKELVHGSDSTCSHQGFIQLSGTCWLNSVINALFMPKEMRDILTFLYYKGSKPKLSYEQIAGDLAAYKEKPEDVFMSLVYQKIIKQNKDIPQVDLLSNFAILCKITFANHLLHQSNCSESEFVEYLSSPLHLDNMITVMQYLLYKYCNGKHIFFMFDTKVNIFALCHINNVMKTKPLIICLLLNENDTILPVIDYDGSNYKLVSCLIGVDASINHLVCGFVCDDKQYIYDSNNLITQDSWSDKSFDNYIEIYKAINKSYKKINILCIFYCLDN